MIHFKAYGNMLGLSPRETVRREEGSERVAYFERERRRGVGKQVYEGPRGRERSRVNERGEE